ncbi:MAG: HAD domain-containing protein, partial [Lachnospiraceae bacterium]|nr:HAD domain-containing protein [Lachnospiraceae bacterium]
MKVIFLDIDGVLNYENSESKVEDEKVKLLKNIVDRTGAEIVLSSDWRYWLEDPDEDIKLLLSVLEKYGLKMFSSTPITKHGYRGAEIYQWLNEWQGEAVDRFVILDDNEDMKTYIDKLVQTDYECGLSYGNVEKAVKLLVCEYCEMGKPLIRFSRINKGKRDVKTYIGKNADYLLEQGA